MGFKIRKGDRVRIIAGEERGKEGKVLRLFPKEGRVLVQGINFIKRHTKPSGKGKLSGIIEKEAPLAISNIMLICPQCNRPTRTGYKIVGKSKKLRVCKKCGETIDKE